MSFRRLQPVIFVLLISLACASHAFADTFDDVVVYRPSNAFWFGSHNQGSPNFYRSTTLGPAPVTSGPTQWGLVASDSPLVGDVNGDGLDDIVVLRTPDPLLGQGQNYSWFAGHTLDDGNGTGAIGSQSFPASDSLLGGFGTAVDPSGVVISEGNFLADVNGDGFDDAVTINAGFNWFSNQSDFFGLGAGPTFPDVPGGDSPVQFGLAGDQPIMGDFNGDGDADIGLYRPAGGTIHIDLTAAGQIGTGDTANNGQIGGNVGQDSLFVANLNGDALDDIVMVRQDGAGLIEWFGLINDGTGFASEGDGDGIPDQGVSPTGYHNFFNPGTTIAGFGLDNGTDIPLIADINGDGMDDIGVYRPAQGGISSWFFTFTTAGGALGTNAFGDEVFAFGLEDDLPLFGEFGSAPPVDLPDYNNNGIVDAADYTVWLDSLGQTGPGLAADGDGNEVIDQEDYLLWKENFGALVGVGTGATVPEPSALALIVFGMLSFAGFANRR